MMENKTMTSSEMAKHYGVTTRLLRFWEAQGILTPERWGMSETQTQRRFSPAERAKFEAAYKAQSLGLTLDQIRACQQPDGTVRIPADMLDELLEQAKRDQAAIMDRLKNAIETRSKVEPDGFATLGRTT